MMGGYRIRRRSHFPPYGSWLASPVDLKPLWFGFDMNGGRQSVSECGSDLHVCPSMLRVAWVFWSIFCGSRVCPCSLPSHPESLWRQGGKPIVNTAAWPVIFFVVVLGSCTGAFCMTSRTALGFQVTFSIYMLLRHHQNTVIMTNSPSHAGLDF